MSIDNHQGVFYQDTTENKDLTHLNNVAPLLDISQLPSLPPQYLPSGLMYKVVMWQRWRLLGLNDTGFLSAMLVQPSPLQSPPRAISKE